MYRDAVTGFLAYDDEEPKSLRQQADDEFEEWRAERGGSLNIDIAKLQRMAAQDQEYQERRAKRNLPSPRRDDALTIADVFGPQR